MRYKKERILEKKIEDRTKNYATPPIYNSWLRQAPDYTIVLYSIIHLPTCI